MDYMLPSCVPMSMPMSRTCNICVDYGNLFFVLTTNLIHQIYESVLGQYFAVSLDKFARMIKWVTTKFTAHLRTSQI